MEMVKAFIFLVVLVATQAINIHERVEIRVFDTDFEPLTTEGLSELLLRANLGKKGFEEIVSNTTEETTNTIRHKFDKKNTLTYRKMVSCKFVTEVARLLRELLPELIGEKTVDDVSRLMGTETVQITEGEEEEEGQTSDDSMCTVGLEMHLNGHRGECEHMKRVRRALNEDCCPDKDPVPCGVCTSNCIVIGKKKKAELTSAGNDGRAF